MLAGLNDYAWQDMQASAPVTPTFMLVDITSP